jgi:hypothetical protein
VPQQTLLYQYRRGPKCSDQVHGRVSSKGRAPTHTLYLFEHPREFPRFGIAQANHATSASVEVDKEIMQFSKLLAIVQPIQPSETTIAKSGCRVPIRPHPRDGRIWSWTRNGWLTRADSNGRHFAARQAD